MARWLAAAHQDFQYLLPVLLPQPYSLLLPFWVGLLVSSSVPLHPPQSILPCSVSLLWDCSGFETMDFIRYPGSNPLTDFIPCVILFWELTLSELPFVICKKEILLFPLIVLLGILNEIMHGNYFEICWPIICVQDMLAVTLAHTFLSLSVLPLLALNCTFSSPFL